MENLLVFLILVAIILVLFTKSSENFQSSEDITKFKGSVHIRGRVDLLTNSNQKVKFDKLCIRDSLTGVTKCIDSQRIAYLINNRDHRLKLFCLGNTCIGKNHMEILNGNNNFKLRDLENNQCLSTTGSKHIHWRESTKYQQHDDDDDAKIQILKNPITYAKCDNTRNINFNLEPIKEDEGAAVNVQRNVVADGGYSRSSDNYIRAQRPEPKKVAFSA